MDPLTSMPMKEEAQKTLSKIKRDGQKPFYDQQQENGLPENEMGDQKKPVNMEQQNQAVQNEEGSLDDDNLDDHKERRRPSSKEIRTNHLKDGLHGSGSDGIKMVKSAQVTNENPVQQKKIDTHSNVSKEQQAGNTISISTGEKDKSRELEDVKVRDAGVEPQSKKEINDQINDGKFEQKPGAILFWGLIVCCAVLMGPMGGGTGLGFVFAPLQLASFAAIPFWKRGTKKTWVSNPSKPTDSLLTTKPGQDGMVTKQQPKDGLTTLQSQKEQLLKQQQNGQGLRGEGDKSNDEVNAKDFANNLTLMINQLVLSGTMDKVSEEDKKIYEVFGEKMQGKDGEKIRQEMFNSVGDKMVDHLHNLMVSKNKEESAKEFINVMAEQILEVSKMPQFKDVESQMQKYAESIKNNEDFRKEFTCNLEDLMKKSKEAGKSLPEYIQSLAEAKNAHQADSVKIDLLQQGQKNQVEKDQGRV